MKRQSLSAVGPLAAAGLIGVTMLSAGISDATDRDDETFAKRDDDVAELVLVDDDDDDESDDGTGMTSPSATDSTASSVAGGVGAGEDRSSWEPA